MSNKQGLYIHIPFCVKKCNYCAFLSFDAETSPRKEYTDALVNEIKLRAEKLRSEAACCGIDADEALMLDTVYVGGGTPSVLDISQMRDIMHAVKTSFRVKEDAEITIEANPATLGRKDGVMLAKLQAYRYMGFNRLSMGVQSMDNDRLHFLGRIHTPENVMRDMELARRKGFDNINLDLIFSVPGQTTADALDDLEKILEFRPEHISCYSLQIEEGTPFGEMAAAGELTEVPDEEDRATYHEICRALEDAGYEHYEISNFARMPDGMTAAGFGENGTAGSSPYRSGHNSLYWNMSDYIGCGLGASGFVDGVRYKNTTDIDEYISFFGALTDTGAAEAEIPLEEEHANTAFDNISEAVFTGLRRCEGISYEDAADAYFRAPDAEGEVPEGAEACREFFWYVFAGAKEEAARYAESGLLVMDNNGLRLTEQGIDISNPIMSLFV